jgi:hypothetical protein
VASVIDKQEQLNKTITRRNDRIQFLVDYSKMCNPDLHAKILEHKKLKINNNTYDPSLTVMPNYIVDIIHNTMDQEIKDI